MVEHYFRRKTLYKMHSAFFTGAQFGKTTTFLLMDTCHVYDEGLHKLRNTPYPIIDISSNGSDLPLALDDQESFLQCTNAYIDFDHCVLRLEETWWDDIHDTPSECRLHAAVNANPDW